jgi:hypothetical protein
VDKMWIKEVKGNFTKSYSALYTGYSFFFHRVIHRLIHCSERDLLSYPQKRASIITIIKI